MFIQTFTDPQGVTHQDALFKIRSANSSITDRESMNIDHSDWSYNTNTSKDSTVNYQMYFWTNQAAFDSGKLPYLLYTRVDGTGSYNFSITPEYEGLSLEAMCDKNCQDVVIPSIATS